MRSLQWERIRSREGERKRTTTRKNKPRQKKAIRQGRFFWRHSNCEERGAEYHPPAQPGDRGTRRSTWCYHENKGKETEREGERCSERSRLGSEEAKLVYLRGKKREPERVPEAEERTGFPCGDLGRGRTLDSAWTPEQSSQLPGSPRLLAPYWKPFLPVCSPLLDSDHRLGKSFYDPCLNVPGVEQLCFWPSQGRRSPVLEIQSLWIMLLWWRKKSFGVW